MNMGEGPAGRERDEPTELPAQDVVGRPRLFQHIWLLIAVVPLTAAAVPAGHGLSGRPWAAFSQGLFLTGSIALTTAVAMITWWIGVRRQRPVEIFRLLIGVAVLCWGLGQFGIALDAVDKSVQYPRSAT